MLGNLDLGIAIFYILLILVVGVLADRCDLRKSRKQVQRGIFWLERHFVGQHWTSAFATNISTIHLVSLAQSGIRYRVA
ncbi:Predicted symporter [Sphingobacterium multivorum]|uniref:Predicted symporter n=1 Tax=Sphingobacterium multivorum TaxID=28454 RepID=A0A2X2J2H5_SPHMU|nr:Predicted symporter [Sphingobacterium multivorum]